MMNDSNQTPCRGSLEGDPKKKSEDDPLAEAATLMTRLLAVIEELMPGVRHIALKRYDELNNAPLDARAFIARTSSSADGGGASS